MTQAVLPDDYITLQSVLNHSQAEELLRHTLAAARCVVWHGTAQETADGTDIAWQVEPVELDVSEQNLALDVSPASSYALACIPDDRERIDAYAARELRAGRSYTQEFRCRGRYGETRWIRESVQVEVIAPGYWQLVGWATDITERKQAYAGLRRTMAVARCLLWYGTVERRATGDLDWQIDVAEYEAAQRFFPIEVEPGEKYADAWYALRLPGDQLRSDEYGDVEVLAGRNYSQEFRCRRADGAIRWFSEDVHVEREAAGFWRLVGVCIDITERKQAEETRLFLASIVESASDPIIGMDSDGIVLSWNPAAERLYGYTAQEAIGSNIARIVPPDRQEELRRNLERIREGQRVEAMETVRITQDGQPIDVSVTASPVRTSDGRALGCAAVMHDIRHIKETERQLTRQVARLTALHAIDSAIAAAADVESVLQTIVEQVASVTQADAATIYLCEPDRLAVAHAASTGFRTPNLPPTRISMQDGLLGAIALARRPMLIESLPGCQQSIHRRRLLEANGLIGYYGLPLVAKGMMKGVIEVFYRRRLTLGSDETDFLNTLAGFAAIAIDNVDLLSSLQRSNLDLAKAYDATIEGWSRALDLRDKETEGHTRRVTEMTLRLAETMQVNHDPLQHIRRGALLHDIGKMGIPDNILLKPGPLTAAEWDIMRKHPVYAYELLTPITFLHPALEIPYCHHERWDGTGYPRGLKGEEIPQAARIFAVADVWDALCSDRPYRKGWPKEQVRAYIHDLAGSHFDPTVVEAFFQLDTSA